MADPYQVERQRLREAEQKARVNYDAFVSTAPLPSEGITADQLEKLVGRLRRELDSAALARIAFEDDHPSSA